MDNSETLARVKTLLGYWIEHNREHSEEFREWADRLRGLGEGAAGGDLTQAAQKMEEAGRLLSRAMESLGGREA